MCKRTLIVGLALLLLVAVLASCAPQSAATPLPLATAAAPTASLPLAPKATVVAPARPAWQDEWDRTLAAAKHEGATVTISTTAGGAIPPTMTKIAKMQGINAEIVSVRTAEILTRIMAERRAGLYLSDFHIGGPQSILNQAKPSGIMEKLDSTLVMPQLSDPAEIKRVWFGGKIPWADQDHTVLIIALQPGTAITINTDLVKPDEVKSWKDLLNPKWAGKVAMNDPTVSGYGPMCVQTMAALMGEDYVKQFAATKPLILRDQRQLVEWLARGKIAISVAAPVEILVEFMQIGAPIKPVLPEEGTWLGPGNAGGVDMFKNAPHPNSTKVFLNWLTTREAQDIFAQAGGFHSTREDATTAHLLPGLARTPNGKYFASYTEEAYSKRPASDAWAKEVFGPLVK